MFLNAWDSFFVYSMCHMHKFAYHLLPSGGLGLVTVCGWGRKSSALIIASVSLELVKEMPQSVIIMFLRQHGLVQPCQPFNFTVSLALSLVCTTLNQSSLCFSTDQECPVPRMKPVWRMDPLSQATFNSRDPQKHTHIDVYERTFPNFLNMEGSPLGSVCES